MSIEVEGYFISLTPTGIYSKHSIELTWNDSCYGTWTDSCFVILIWTESWSCSVDCHCLDSSTGKHVNGPMLFVSLVSWSDCCWG